MVSFTMNASPETLKAEHVECVLFVDCVSVEIEKPNVVLVFEGVPIVDPGDDEESSGITIPIELANKASDKDRGFVPDDIPIDVASVDTNNASVSFEPDLIHRSSLASVDSAVLEPDLSCNYSIEHNSTKSENCTNKQVLPDEAESSRHYGTHVGKITDKVALASIDRQETERYSGSSEVDKLFGTHVGKSPATT